MNEQTLWQRSRNSLRKGCDSAEAYCFRHFRPILAGAMIGIAASVGAFSYHEHAHNKKMQEIEMYLRAKTVVDNHNKTADEVGALCMKNLNKIIKLRDQGEISFQEMEHLDYLLKDIQSQLKDYYNRRDYFRANLGSINYIEDDDEFNSALKEKIEKLESIKSDLDGVLMKAREIDRYLNTKKEEISL